MEKAFIGTVLSNLSLIHEVSDVRASDMSCQSHQILWEKMLSLSKTGNTTPRGIVEFIKKDGYLDTIGTDVDDGSVTGDLYVQELLSYRSEPDIRKFADEVISSSIKRELYGFAQLLAMDAEGEDEANKIIESAEERLFNLRRRKVDTGVDIGEILEMFDDRIDKWRSGEVKPSFEFKMKRVSEILEFLEDQDFMIVGGRPGWGKSSYLRYEAFRSAKSGKRVVMFNLENNEIEYARYLIALMTGIDTNLLKDPRKLSEGLLAIVKKAIVDLRSMSGFLKVVTMGGPSVNEIIQIASKLARDGYEVIFVDYLQLIQNGKEGELENITFSSVALRALAMKYKVPVICASQMSREIEKRGENAEPVSSDLRYAGEMDATVILFPRVIMTDDAGLREFPENLDSNGRLKSIARVVPLRFYLTKYRNGGTGVSGLVKWDKATNNYTSI